MADLLPLKIYPNPILRQKCRKVEAKKLQSQEIKQLILNMEKTMVENDGIGLAACQVGRDIRICLVRVEDGSLALINPKIVRKSFKKELGEEGCLSIPGVYGQVKRSLKVRVKALDKNGKEIDFRAEGLFARVVQHEIDHLNGVLFIDKAKEITQGEEKLEKMNQGSAISH